MKQLTLIIPAKNESASLPAVLQELEKFNIKKIVIIDKSDVRTKKSIKDFEGYNCKIFKQKSNGYGAAIIEGINHIRTKYFCIFNADGSFDPSSLQLMFKKIHSRYHFVFASRYHKGAGSDDDTIVTFIGNKIFTLIGKIFFKIEISDILYTYTAGHTSKFKMLNLLYNDYRLCIELPINIKKKNFKYTTIPSFERPRYAGKKNVNEIKDGFLILCALIKLYFKNLKDVYNIKSNFNSISRFIF
jgi:glycosyltransferase involved in cell wall biosynthesis